MVGDIAMDKIRLLIFWDYNIRDIDDNHIVILGVIIYFYIYFVYL